MHLGTAASLAIPSYEETREKEEMQKNKETEKRPEVN